jgi:hypothetical protein
VPALSRVEQASQPRIEVRRAAGAATPSGSLAFFHLRRCGVEEKRRALPGAQKGERSSRRTLSDGTYFVEFETSAGEAILIARTDAAVVKYFQERMPYGFKLSITIFWACCRAQIGTANRRLRGLLAKDGRPRSRSNQNLAARLPALDRKAMTYRHRNTRARYRVS